MFNFGFRNKKNEIKVEEKKEEPVKEVIVHKTVPTDTEKQIIKSSIQEIRDEITKFTDLDIFIEKSKQFASEELRENIAKELDHKFIYYLIFGEIPSAYNDASKVDYNKNCRAFQLNITDVLDLRKSVRYLRKIIRYYDDFHEKISEIYSDLRETVLIGYPSNSEIHSVIERLNIMLGSYTNDVSYCFNIISDLLCILNEYYEKNPNSIGEKLKVVKHDTLKRYYFTHTYSLKGAVKIFTKETMIFGEINNIIKQYNYIYNFVFGTIVTNVQTMKTIFDSLKLA